VRPERPRTRPRTAAERRQLEFPLSPAQFLRQPPMPGAHPQAEPGYRPSRSPRPRGPTR
jgi:hypothetical protein